jgi:hypothetical protein
MQHAEETIIRGNGSTARLPGRFSQSKLQGRRAFIHCGLWFAIRGRLRKRSELRVLHAVCHEHVTLGVVAVIVFAWEFAAAIGYWRDRNWQNAQIPSLALLRGPSWREPVPSRRIFHHKEHVQISLTIHASPIRVVQDLPESPAEVSCFESGR